MLCKSVRLLHGDIIECVNIDPNKTLPGFYSLKMKNGRRCIINGLQIVEVVTDEEESNWGAQVL